MEGEKINGKENIMGLFLVIIICLFVQYQGPTKRYIFYNMLYDEKVIYELMDQSISFIDQDGLHIDEIRYDGSKTLLEEKRRKDENNEEIIHLYMDISTDFFGAPSNWGENMTYKDYEIVFSKNDKGQWEIISNGYG